MNQKTKSGLKIISKNRKAHYNYFFKEFFEAGIVLYGSEVKSLRDSKVNISESYAFDNKGEIYLVNSHIPSYKESSYNNHDPKRNRKLLLNKREINKLIGRINREGFTLIPTKIYFKKLYHNRTNTTKTQGTTRPYAPGAFYSRDRYQISGIC